MKILQIAHSFPPESMTGSEIYAYNLSLSLAKNHTVSIFYRVDNPEQEEYEVIKDNYNGLTVYKINNTLKYYRSLKKIYNNKDIENKFLAVLKEAEPDIIHMHHLLFLSTGIIHEIKKQGIPIVFTLHDYWLVCQNGKLLKNNLRLCKDPVNANCLFCSIRFFNLKNLSKKLFYFLIQNMVSKARNIELENIYKDVDLFISPSIFLLNKFIELGMPSAKIIHSGHGINIDLFNDIKKTKSDKIRFGFIGTLIPSKGAHILIKAFNKIKEDKATLKIYGKSFTGNRIFGYYYKIKRMARRNKDIIFMDVFDNKNISDIFKEIDVLIFPSIWHENSPLVLHEAILSKTPVIASDIGGVKELINCYNGILFNVGDVKGLQEKMQYIIDKPENIERLKNDTPKVKSIKDNAKELEEIYSSILKHAQ